MRLLPLLDNDDLTVRREAATACLRVAAPKAEAALESVARDGTYPDIFLAREAPPKLAEQRTDRLRRLKPGFLQGDRNPSAGDGVVLFGPSAFAARAADAPTPRILGRRFAMTTDPAMRTLHDRPYPTGPTR